ncbi:hypothetical protein CDL15_Pgr000677 [Punica granatum]|uniref:Uncharacterized protein n=1 Tax=Punica granatum TaxID=22663 RepID=A0A218W372_PUNGR|nr:hypothetical protein CDL15_Pgr000677 [Punica granatum]
MRSVLLLLETAKATRKKEHRATAIGEDNGPSNLSPRNIGSLIRIPFNRSPFLFHSRARRVFCKPTGYEVSKPRGKKKKSSREEVSMEQWAAWYRSLPPPFDSGEPLRSLAG